jgi:hypothetical protein
MRGRAISFKAELRPLVTNLQAVRCAVAYALPPKTALHFILLSFMEKINHRSASYPEPQAERNTPASGAKKALPTSSLFSQRKPCRALLYITNRNKIS